MRRTFICALVVLALAFAPFSGALAQANKPRVKFATNMGDIVIELEAARMPETVENFLAYVRAGHYDGTIFHRVIRGFVVQGGGFTRDYQRKTTRRPIRNEADKGLSNERRTIAMARTPDPHSATDQFYFNTRFNGMLNHRAKTPSGWGYAAFGKVVDGMNIVSRISRVPTGPGGPFLADVPQAPVVIEKASVLN